MVNLDLVSNKLYTLIGNTLNNSINLRKVKKIIIKEKYGTHSPRPQQHLMLVAPFGTFKSTVINLLENLLNNDLVIADDATKASLLGTITRDRQYVEGVLSACGGKILAIDEWDSLNYDATQCLLSPLENMRINRNLGFSVKELTEINNDFTNMRIEKGMISGKVQFTCISMSMGYPTKGKAQLALNSRFRLIKIPIDETEIKKIIKGLVKFKFIDRNQVVESVTVEEKCWNSFVDHVYNEIDMTGSFPPNQLLGYVNRSIIDGLRDSISKLIIDDPRSSYVIDDSNVLIASTDNIIEQLGMYVQDVPTVIKLRELVDRFPNEKARFFMSKLNISQSHYYQLRSDIENSLKQKLVYNNE